jgi:hypothetical protein
MAGRCVNPEVELIVEYWYAVNGRTEIPEVDERTVRKVLHEMESFEAELSSRYKLNPLLGWLVKRHPKVQSALELCRHRHVLRAYLIKAKLSREERDIDAVTSWMKEMEDIEPVAPS